MDAVDDKVVFSQLPSIEKCAARTRKRKLSSSGSNCSVAISVKPEPPPPISVNTQLMCPGTNVQPPDQESPLEDDISPPPTILSSHSNSLNMDVSDGASQHASDSGGDTCQLQCIRFSPFQPHLWHTLCDQSLHEMYAILFGTTARIFNEFPPLHRPVPHYRVDADKGFNFSGSDDAFVCQKKNHFQVTCHAQIQGGSSGITDTTSALFLRTSVGFEKIKSFHLHFYGVKLEAPTQMIRVEQSQSDRSKKPFHPVLLVFFLLPGWFVRLI